MTIFMEYGTSIRKWGGAARFHLPWAGSVVGGLEVWIMIFFCSGRLQFLKTYLSSQVPATGTGLDF